MTGEGGIATRGIGAGAGREGGCDADLSDALLTRVRAAHEAGLPLRVVGGGSKTWYGRSVSGQPLNVGGHRGIVNYEPTELVMTARAGTPLTEIEAVLAQHGQCLAFEPPHFGTAATLGGTLACGLSGPARPYLGAARDFVLGVRILNGRGESLRFGGEVMKNVAGYDLSRLMVGALGSLGVLLDISLKVLPRPAAELTLARECTVGEGLATLAGWAKRPLPLTASLHDGDRLYVRLAGSATAVRAARQIVGGESVEAATGLWEAMREQRHGYFAGDAPLWRFAVAAGVPAPELPGKWLLEWGGGQRWYRGGAAPAELRSLAQALGGHVTLFRGGERSGDVFQPLAAPVLALHRRLKLAFDPDRVLNPGVLYADL